MGRSGGSNKGATPDWLKTAEEREGPSLNRREQRAAEKDERRRPPRHDDDDDDKKGGIRCLPIAFLLLMTMPAVLPVVLDVFDKLQKNNLISLPTFIAGENPYKPCLMSFYADWAPEKLEPRNLDETLRKYEGREKQMFAALGKKYGKKANFARCVPKKKDS